MVSSRAKLFETLAGGRKQLGRAGEIPVRVRNLAVAQISREGCNGMIDIDSLLIPAKEPSAGKAMAHVVHARFGQHAVAAPAQLVPQPSEYAYCTVG